MAETIRGLEEVIRNDDSWEGWPRQPAPKARIVSCHVWAASRQQAWPLFISDGLLGNLKYLVAADM
eukprot:6323625-Amphidinium_carterae.1